MNASPLRSTETTFPLRPIVRREARPAPSIPTSPLRGPSGNLDSPWSPYHRPRDLRKVRTPDHESYGGPGNAPGNPPGDRGPALSDRRSVHGDPLLRLARTDGRVAPDGLAGEPQNGTARGAGHGPPGLGARPADGPSPVKPAPAPRIAGERAPSSNARRFPWGFAVSPRRSVCPPIWTDRGAGRPGPFPSIPDPTRYPGRSAMGVGAIGS